MNQGPSRKIFKVGEKILTTIAKPVSLEEFKDGTLAFLADQLMIVAKEMGAVGFSAPQLGYSKRVMSIGMEFSNPRRPNVKQFPNRIFINPEIIYASSETATDWEGCASFDKLLAYVNRAVTIKYRAQDLAGNLIEGQLDNFPARVFQHELDHLNGVLMDTKAIRTKKFDVKRNSVISMKP